MTPKILSFISLWAALAVSNLSFATKQVDDNFAADGTEITDANYFGSSSSSAIEFNANSIGLVSGASGRQLHALFETQTLANAGDSLRAMISFTTPATVASTNEDIRIGLFDHLERVGSSELGQNTSYGSTAPNANFSGLPGFYLELDIESADMTTDLDIRRSNPSDSGRLLATTSGFTSLGSGPDIGYVISANTDYTVVFTLTRTVNNGLEIRADFGEDTFTVTDTSPASFNVGMLAMGASSGALGNSSTPSDPMNVVTNNGLDITSFAVEFIPNPDGGGDTGGGDTGGNDSSTAVVDDDFLNDGTADTDAQYFTTNNLNAIEFNADSLGLVSGTSGRHIHGLFDSQPLERVGDTLRAAISFKTPATVAVGGEDIRLGLFDSLGRTSNTELGQNTTFSSSSPNPLVSGLPGYYVEIDVERFSSRSDLEIGRSTPTTTGRLLNTNGGFERTNGEDIGYTIEPDTDYTIYLSMERTETGIEVTANFFGRELVVMDDLPLSFNFDMLAINASSDAFGTSNRPGEADNGIDITNINIELIRSNAVDDDLATDGTANTDIDYFASSSSSAIEINDNSIGLVTGTSGRQIHGLFDTQRLVEAGDTLETSVTFVTPATVTLTGGDIRIGFFDHLDRTNTDQLRQNTSFSSTTPDLNYSGLPGFFLGLDVESADTSTNLEIRRSDPTASGRLLTTTSGFTSLGSSMDIGYAIAAETEYTVNLTFERTEADGLDITARFLDNMFSVTDVNPASFNFGMIAVYANGGAMGSSNAPGMDPAVVNDNGIDITNVSVQYQRFFEPPVVDLPPVELPEGDHPDIEIIPDVPEAGDSDEDSGAGGDSGGAPVGPGPDVPSSPGSGTGNVIAALPGIISLVLDETEAEPTPELSNAEKIAAYFGLDPSAQPWENFDLSDWALDGPNADPADGFSARTTDADFADGKLFPGTEPFFFTGSDGAMVFKSIIGGVRTSQNTSFARSELREMLRAGNTDIPTQGINANNWALDHQPVNNDIGARGGKLTATLSIDQVSSTGASGQVGRVIIGQIHAENDEPMRLYYRKLPGNTKGGIYAVHEVRNGNDINFDIIGSRANDAADPIVDGIAPGEIFSYEITNVGATLEVVIRRGDRNGPIINEPLIINMNTVNNGAGSGYDVAEEWMYFKAGAYSQNNTGWRNDFDQVRFYRLENSH
ncbi:MAG: polysaccharide lyase family 7 protein [Acidiferrobacterales bacterium]|nr:polysaccharide lyase family 7 protein [Acidiferrobacterales bacterium]